MGVSTIDAAPEHVRFAVLQLASDGMPPKQLVKWLVGHGIVVTSDVVGYHLRKNGIYTDQKWWVDPADTHAGRMKQYVTALATHNSDTFRLWDIDLRGRVWGTCTRILLSTGAIEKVRCSGQWYRIVATKEGLVALAGRDKQ